MEFHLALQNSSAMATWRDVSRYANALPEALEDQTSGGGKAWRVKGKLFVWERPLRKSDRAALGANAPEGDILGVMTADLEMKEALIKSDPAVFFTSPHFNGYAAVLVQLQKISAKDLKPVITEAWLARAPKRLADAYLRRI